MSDELYKSMVMRKVDIFYALLRKCESKDQFHEIINPIGSNDNCLTYAIKSLNSKNIFKWNEIMTGIYQFIKWDELNSTQPKYKYPLTDSIKLCVDNAHDLYHVKHSKILEFLEALDYDTSDLTYDYSYSYSYYA